MEEKKNKKKKRKLKWYVKLFLLIILVIIYAFFIGTKGIFIKEYKIETKKIDKQTHGLKILQFSDLHYGSSVNMSMVKELTKKINKTKPDIVIFTGDLINKNYKINTDEEDELKGLLSKINADIGKYYITGEEDFENAKEILNISGFENLKENPQIIYTSVTNKLLLIDKKSCKTFFQSDDNNDYFRILVLHNPDNIDDVKDINFDMAIAGHTHNGQINVYKVKDLFIDSKYKNDYQIVNNTPLYINPGIGTSKLNVRLFNHPTVFLYRINKASN